MTICIAAIFHWKYGDNDIGPAVITASDRMMTVGDVEYEAQKQKVGMLGARATILVAGEMSAHSEAIAKTSAIVAAVKETDVEKIAEIYGRHLREYRLRQAVQRYLAPFGLDEGSLIARQQEMAPAFRSELTDNMARHRLDVEAIIAGFDDKGVHVIHVDDDGFCTNQNDTSFVSIGIGYHHANALFMSSDYSDSWGFSKAMFLAYAAKRAAESAPGVGRTTDMHLMTRDGLRFVEAAIFSKVEESYVAFSRDQKTAFDAAVERLMIAPDAEPEDVTHSEAK